MCKETNKDIGDGYMILRYFSEEEFSGETVIENYWDISQIYIRSFQGWKSTGVMLITLPVKRQ